MQFRKTLSTLQNKISNKVKNNIFLEQKLINFSEMAIEINFEENLRAI